MGARDVLNVVENKGFLLLQGIHAIQVGRPVRIKPVKANWLRDAPTV